MPELFLAFKLWITGIFMSLFTTVAAIEQTRSEKKEESERMAAIAMLSKNSAFPVETLPEAVSTTISENGNVVAKQTLLKYSPNQAYCVVSTYDDRLDDADIQVMEDKENPLDMKLVSIEDEKVNKLLLPVVIRFHYSLKRRSAESHMCDRSFEKVMGTFNMELKKNITIDSFERLNSWRDEAGFIVTDRNHYALTTFSTADLFKELQGGDCAITAYNSADFDTILNFDHSVCGANRMSLVEKLTTDSKILMAKSNDYVDGFIAGKGDRIICCYAETVEIAHALFKKYIVDNKLHEVTFFTRTGVWSSTPLTTQNVYRYHTRAVPSNLKWNKVFAANMGVHLV